jgi:hypothetical protein
MAFPAAKVADPRQDLDILTLPVGSEVRSGFLQKCLALKSVENLE